MYYIVESPKIITLPIIDVGHVRHMRANRDNMFVCAITSTDITIWFTSTNTLVAFHQRADNSISIHGENYMVEWKNDSSKIVVLTTKGFLIYYKISFENEFIIHDLSTAQTSWEDSLFSNRNQYQNPLLSGKIVHEFSIHVQNAQKSLCCFNDEIFISLLNGKVIKVPWNDRTRTDHFFLALQQIYFKVDLEGELFKIRENVFVTEFEIAGLDDGYVCMAAVLSDSSAIYLYSDSSNVFRGLIAKSNNQDKHVYHRCVAINPLYRILTFGCKNGIVLSYHQPDEYTSLQVANNYVLPAGGETTTATNVKWSPDYKVLCVLYDSGSFALFSVFGSPLYCSKDAIFQDGLNSFQLAKTTEFSIEGFSLWTYVQNADSNSSQGSGSLFKLKLLKSSHINNNYMSNVEHISLNGEREVYVCLNLAKTNALSSMSKPLEEKTSSQYSPKYQFPSLKLGGNSIWQVLNLPVTYISSNFPVKMSAIDPEGKYLAVAGSRGFTHFSFVTRKWRMFGNADQEKDLRVTGGLLWWKEFICLSCFNSADQRNEIRFYSRNSNLDNNYSKISKMNTSILQMNIFRNLLVIFGSDCRVQVLGLEGGKDSTSKIILNKLIEIPINSYIFNNPYLAVYIGLCPLYIGNYNDSLKKTIESTTSTMKSILINVSGNLLMFQPDMESLLSIPEDLNKTKPFSSLPPIIIASSVENNWVITNPLNLSNNKLINYFMNLSLWINCGSNGIKVWLPLSGEENEVQQSNRIVLTFHLNFYPLGLLINEALFIGATSELVNLNQTSIYNQIQKTTQLFLPFILEGLVRRKLDIDACKIAHGYRYLPYFLHVLELLVHKTLEEEADMSDKEKNRILPSVIDFVNHFPEHLRIISHCTRKSEVAVWPYLFSVVGSSRDLFEKCIALNDLETAGSYLIVLQNTENVKECERLANKLLKTALKNSEWHLIKEITRFISAIDPVDLETEVFDSSIDGTNQTTNVNNVSRASISKSIISRTSTSSIIPATSSPNKLLTSNDSFDKSLTNKQQHQQPLNKSVSSVVSNEFDMIHRKSIESSLFDYANELIGTYRVKNLFEMFSNLRFINFTKWLQISQSKRLIESYVQAISQLHFDFNWPYPIVISHDTAKKSNSSNGNSGHYNHHHHDDLFDFDLISHELANTGSSQSEEELLYIVDILWQAKFYEWVFLLALVLKKFTICNEVVGKTRSSRELEAQSISIREGIKELDAWSLNECCGYRPIIQKIKSMM